MFFYCKDAKAIEFPIHFYEFSMALHIQYLYKSLFIYK